MAASTRSPAWQRALIVLSGVTVAVVAAATLYWAQEVLIPVALAVFVAFLLNPLVTRLQRKGVGRGPAVLVVVSVTLIVGTSVGWLVSTQIRDLAAGMPQYTQNLKKRARFLRSMGRDGILEELNRMAREVGAVWDEPAPAKDPQAPSATEAAPIIVQAEPGPTWVSHILTTVPFLLRVAGSGALALVLAVFMLLKREDLRNRLLWLTGRSRVALTTKAFDDIGQRIGRYLLTQLTINGMVGVAVALGLLVIGVEHWLLWGFLTALLRYVPYLGASIAAVFPIALSLAQFEGWTLPLVVVGWLIFLELLAANVLEPWLFGKSIGVSGVAMLTAACFWTFLWGPAGLMLSGPLTVCLLVIGEYVPTLRFLAVILGDGPALEPDIGLFQRLAAGDQDEAISIVAAYLRDHPHEQVYDELLLPALAQVRVARANDELGESDKQFIIDAMQWIIDDLDDVAAARADRDGEPMATPMRIVACAAHDELDELGLAMLAKLLDRARCELHVVPATLLASELIAVIEQRSPDALCIGSLAPGGIAHTRYLCKRLHTRFPELKLLVGRWLEATVAPPLRDPLRDPLREAGADAAVFTLITARDQLAAWMPVLEETSARANAAPAYVNSATRDSAKSPGAAD